MAIVWRTHFCVSTQDVQLVGGSVRDSLQCVEKKADARKETTPTERWVGTWTRTVEKTGESVTFILYTSYDWRVGILLPHVPAQSTPTVRRTRIAWKRNVLAFFCCVWIIFFFIRVENERNVLGYSLLLLSLAHHRRITIYSVELTIIVSNKKEKKNTCSVRTILSAFYFFLVVFLVQH